MHSFSREQDLCCCYIKENILVFKQAQCLGLESVTSIASKNIKYQYNELREKKTLELKDKTNIHLKQNSPTLLLQLWLKKKTVRNRVTWHSCVQTVVPKFAADLNRTDLIEKQKLY